MSGADFYNILGTAASLGASAASPLDFNAFWWARADRTLNAPGNRVEVLGQTDGSLIQFSKAGTGRPTFIPSAEGGLPAIDWLGGDDNMQTVATKTYGGSFVTMFYAYVPVALAAGAFYQHGSGLDAARLQVFSTTEAVVDTARFPDRSAKKHTQVGIVGTAYRVWTQVCRSTHLTHRLRLDGVDTAASTFAAASGDPSSAATAVFDLGSTSPGAGGINMRLREGFCIEIVGGSPTNDDIVALEAAMVARWNP